MPTFWSLGHRHRYLAMRLCDLHGLNTQTGQVVALSEFGVHGLTDVDHVVDVQSANWRPDGNLHVVAMLRERAGAFHPRDRVSPIELEHGDR